MCYYWLDRRDPGPLRGLECGDPGIGTLMTERGIPASVERLNT